MPLLLSLHLIFTAFMTGVIWLVQLVHYPAFQWIDSARFTQFCAFHVKFTTIVVAPVMIAELATAILLLFAKPLFQNSWLLWLNLLLILLIWTSTHFLSVPLHERLAQGYDPNVMTQLVTTNWPRTILWTTRLILVLFFLRGR